MPFPSWEASKNSNLSMFRITLITTSLPWTSEDFCSPQSVSLSVAYLTACHAQTWFQVCSSDLFVLVINTFTSKFLTLLPPTSASFVTLKGISCLWRVPSQVSGNQRDNAQFIKHLCGPWVSKYSQMSNDFHCNCKTCCVRTMEKQRHWHCLREVKAICLAWSMQAWDGEPVSDSEIHTFYFLLR